MIKERLKSLVEGACTGAINQGNLPFTVTIENPRDPAHGDFACGVALSQSAGNVQVAMSIAHNIVEALKAVPKDICTITAENPGFVNFRLGPYWLCQSLCELHVLSESFSPSAKDGKIDSQRIASIQEPSFYIQYMHAKLSAYLRLAQEVRINMGSCRLEPAIVDLHQWPNILHSFKQHPLVFKPLFNIEESIFAEQKALVLHLDSYQEQLSKISSGQGKKCITDYAYQLALKLDQLPEVWQLITISEDVTKSHLGLIVVGKRVLAHALGIIGLEAPEAI